MKKKAGNILLTIGLIICLIAVLITAFGNLIIKLVMAAVLNTSSILHIGSSTSVIGGADGPTVIFVSESQSVGPKILLIIFFLILAFIFFRLLIFRRKPG